MPVSHWDLYWSNRFNWTWQMKQEQIQSGDLLVIPPLIVTTQTTWGTASHEDSDPLDTWYKWHKTHSSSKGHLCA